MPHNKELESFQKRLDKNSQFDDHIFQKSLGALTGKGSFTSLGLQGPGTFMTAKAPNLDELDGNEAYEDL